MGVRFRKSIRLGGGFKINFSKSGVGYSWGTRGYRLTRKSGGGTRHTVSIPGSGISYVHDSKKKTSSKRKKETAYQVADDVNVSDTTDIENGNVNKMVSDGLESLISSANLALILNAFTTAVIFIGMLLALIVDELCLIATGVGVILKIVVRIVARIDLNYSVDADMRAEIDRHMAPLEQIVKSKKIWYISQSKKITNSKYEGGATSALKREIAFASKRLPFPFRTDEKAAYFRCGREKLVFLPDKFLIIKNLRVGALNYSDMMTSFEVTKFIEDGIVPSDAEIIQYTWKYVNKSGDRDKRFSNNKKLPVCKYGEMHISSKEKGINTIIMFSNGNIEL